MVSFDAPKLLKKVKSAKITSRAASTLNIMCTYLQSPAPADDFKSHLYVL